MNCKILVGLLALAAPLHAAVWEYAPAVIDEVVIDTSTPVRAPRFEKIDHQQLATFKDFRYPHNNSHGEITFIANDFRKFGYPQDDMHGIYRSYADGRLIPIAVRSMPVPGLEDDTADFFDGLQSHNSTLVFRAITQKARFALLTYHNGELKTLFHSGQQTALGKINDLCYGMPYGQQAIVTAEILGDSPNADSPRWGAYIYDLKDNFLVPLMTQSSPIPGREDLLQATFYQPTLTLRKGIAYIRATLQRIGVSADSSSEIFSFHEGLYRAVSSREDGRFIGGEFKIEKVFDSLDNNSLSRRSRNYVSSLGADELEKLKSERPRLRPFSIYTVAASDTVWATLCITADFAEHILINTPRGFQILVDTDTAIPDLFPGAFSQFGRYLQVHDDMVYFYGGNKNFRGLFAYDTTLDRLYLVLDMSEKIEEKTIEHVETGFTALYKNRMALAIKFTDGSAGVYLATLPERYFLKK